MIKWSLSLLLLMCCITLIDLRMLKTTPESLGWSQLGRDEWSFGCAVGFGLPLFYWGFLHQWSLRRLPTVPFFWRCLFLVLGWV
jgi:hypothetical protein